MKKYKMHDAKTNLSKIISQVNEGETIYLAKSERIVAQINSYSSQKSFPFGAYKDKIHVSEDWDSADTNDQIANTFYGADL